MSVKVRLVRMGSKNTPFYRVIAIDGRKATNGRYIERLGWYDPTKDGVNFQLKMESVEKWINNGAEVSDTVRSLIKKHRQGPKPQKVVAAPAEPEITEAPAEAAEEVAEESIAAQAEEETAGEEVVEDAPEEQAEEAAPATEEEAEKKSE